MNPTKILTASTTAFILLLTPGSAFSGQTGAAASVVPSPADAAVIRAQKPAYPLASCVACGKPLAETPVDHVREGRLYRLDSASCAKTVDADPAAMGKKIDEAVIAAQKASYPLKTSPVSDKTLDDKAVEHVHGTRLVRLASQDEVAAFQKDPAAAMAKVDKAWIAAQLPGYPLKNCVVTDEAMGGEMGEPVDYLYGTKLVRFCCRQCVRQFEKQPDKYLKALAVSK